jgi:hypothetical protein
MAVREVPRHPARVESDLPAEAFLDVEPNRGYAGLLSHSFERAKFGWDKQHPLQRAL